MGQFSLHTTSIPEVAARSSAVAYGYWIGNLVLLAGCGLACFIGSARLLTDFVSPDYRSCITDSQLCSLL